MKAAEYRRFIAARELEDDFLQWVIDLATLLGWLVFHPRPAKVMVDGEWQYRTAYTGNDGYFDLTLIKGGVVILAELKSATGTTTAPQRTWIEAAGEHAHLWRPEDRPQIEHLLRTAA